MLIHFASNLIDFGNKSFSIFYIYDVKQFVWQGKHTSVVMLIHFTNSLIDFGNKLYIFNFFFTLINKQQ